MYKPEKIESLTLIFVSFIVPEGVLLYISI